MKGIKRKLLNKKGSFVVFGIMIASAIIIAIGLGINYSLNYWSYVTSKSISKSSQLSLMSEYDLFLRDRYDIFAIYGDEDELGKKMDFYMNESLGNKKYASYENSTISTYGYNLQDVKNFKDQVVRGGKYSLGKSAISKVKDVAKNRGRSDDNAGGSLEKKPNDSQGLGANQRTYVKKGSNAQIDFSRLPSACCEDEGFIERAGKCLSKIKDIEGLAKAGSDNFFECEYILDHFKLNGKCQDEQATYFENEVEYILSGYESDDGNRRALKYKVIGIRTILNLMYLETSEDKQKIIEGASALLTPVVGQGIALAWATLEACNDYELLIAGKKVPILKDDDTWAMDIMSLISNTELGYVDTGADKGLTLEEYVLAMLYLMDENTRLYRIMDLIEINGKSTYWEAFKLDSFAVGFRGEYRICGRGVIFEQSF